jgi:hypothetical protein
MPASGASAGSLITRMQGDFFKTPGLMLTLRDAQHRMDLDGITCEARPETLVDAGVLTRTREGAYVRFFPRLVPRAGAPREIDSRQGPSRRVAKHAA